MAEAAFSGDGKYYSALTQDGRLRIWDTETNVLKQEYTPDLHLTAPPSCIQWLSVAQTAKTPQKDKRKSSVSEEEAKCIALGTKRGKILIYSVAQAKVETVLGSDKNGSKSDIISLDWHRKYGLYSSSKNNLVCEWDISTAKVKNKYNVRIESNSNQANFVSAIKIVPHKQDTSATYLVTSSWQVHVWRLSNSEAVVIRSLGHKASQKALLTIATLNNMTFLVEGSQNERLLSFWDVTVTEDHTAVSNTTNETPPSKKQRRKSISKPAVTTTPAYNFVLEDAPRLIDVQLKDEGEGTRLEMAAATRSGVVHYYGLVLNGSSTKPIKPSVTIQSTTESANPLPLQCCQVTDTGLTVGYTNGVAYFFEKIVPDLKSKTQVLIRNEPKERKSIKNKQVNEVNRVLADETASASLVGPLGGVGRKRQTPGAQMEVEVPMESRLQNLSLEGARGGAVNKQLTRLLMQGLHSKDYKILSLVLKKTDYNLALRTVEKLPPEYVPLVLEQLVEQANRSTVQCAAVCAWTKAILDAHSALLLASRSSHALRHVNTLLAVFMQRRSRLCQLLNLRGRLTLTHAHRARATAETPHEPVLDYRDSSDEEEMEVGYQSDNSVQSWNDKLELSSDEEEVKENGLDHQSIDGRIDSEEDEDSCDGDE